MADQVNLPGGLSPGVVQTFQGPAVPPQPKPAPARPEESKPKATENRGIGVPKESLEQATRHVEDFLQRSPSELKFQVDAETGISYFRIVDPVTHETIRQVPAEEIIEMSKRLRSLSDAKDASGLLMDEEG